MRGQTCGGRGFFLPDFFFLVCLLGVGWLAALFLHGPADILIVPAILPLIAAFMLLTWDALPRLPPACGWLAAWWLYLAASSLWSSAPFVSDLILLLLAPLPFVCIAVVATGPLGAARLAAAALGGLALLALATVWQFLLPSRADGPRIHAPFLDPNSLAAAMTIGLLPNFMLFLQAATPAKTKSAGALTLLFLAGLLATQSRGGLLAAALTGFAMLALHPGKAVWRRAALLAPFGLLVAGGMGIYDLLTNDRDAFLHLASTVPRNFTDRLALWSASLRMIAVHPCAGSGLGTFSYWYPRFRQPADHSDGYFAHNDLLQFWLEGGILSPALFLAFVIACLAPAVRAARKDRTVNAARLAGPAALLALLVQSFFSYEFYLPALLLPLAILLGWSDTAVAPSAADTAVPHVKIWRACLIALAMFAAQWTVRAGIGIDAVRLAALAETRGDAPAMAAALRPAQHSAPGNDFAVPQYEARRYALLVKTSGAAGRALDVAAGLHQLDRARALNTGFAYLDVTKADLLAASTIPDAGARASLVLAGVLRRDPLCLEARFKLSALQAAAGQDRAAMQTLGEGLNWPRPAYIERPLLSRLSSLCASNGDDACVATLGARLNDMDKER